MNAVIPKDKKVASREIRSYTNRAVQPQKMARGLKLKILEVKGLFYLCSENKSADRHLCFCNAKKKTGDRKVVS